MSIRKNELELFPTPISLYDLSDLDLDSIVDCVEGIDKEEFHLLDNGKTDYQIGDNLLDNPDLVQLKEHIEHCIEDYSRKLGFVEIKLSGSWSSITDIGGRLELHRHEMSMVSGVFYPKVDCEISPLLFKNPIWQYKMAECYDFSIQSKYASFYDFIKPHSGLLILFPSWLEHKTDKEIGRRIIISFNAEIDK
tara:strand:- start:78 stop:656 length:579 start_codon:yes stop_codon:yes gene_type:complete